MIMTVIMSSSYFSLIFLIPTAPKRGKETENKITNSDIVNEHCKFFFLTDEEKYQHLNHQSSLMLGRLFLRAISSPKLESQSPGDHCACYASWAGWRESLGEVTYVEG